MEYRQGSDRLNEINNYLSGGVLQVDAHSSWAALLNAIETRDFALWGSVVQDLQRLVEISSAAEELAILKNKLQDLPSWLRHIAAEVIQGYGFIPEEWRA